MCAIGYNKCVCVYVCVCVCVSVISHIAETFEAIAFIFYPCVF